MNAPLNPRRLSIAPFTQAAARLSGSRSGSEFGRLLPEPEGSQGVGEVFFEAFGELRPNAKGAMSPWIRLEAHTTLPMVCQRCLEPVDVEIAVSREFRFVATEAQAELEDDQSEEDVLVSAPDFDLLALVEDELLMALPPSPKHQQCPHRVKLAVADKDFVVTDEVVNPFAVLGQLKTPKG
ncbi:MAG: DUF177 domain-containing protein [Betaproteobacteria bacterium]